MAVTSGITDGCGLAAALLLSAQGINICTPFLSSVETAVTQEWKNRIVSVDSEDAIKAGFISDVFFPLQAKMCMKRHFASRTA